MPTEELFGKLAEGYPAIRLTLQGPFSDADRIVNVTNASYVSVLLNGDVKVSVVTSARTLYVTVLRQKQEDAQIEIHRDFAH